MAPASRVMALFMTLLAIALLTFAIRMRCTATTPAPKPPPPRIVDAKWFWYSEGVPGPWRLPERIMGVAFADHATAVAISETAMYRISIATGEVSAPIEVLPSGSWMHAVARVGERVIAFGQVDEKPAAWELTPSSALPIPLDDPKPVEPKGLTGGGVAVSPDGAYVVICTGVRPPIIRETKTFKAKHVLVGEGCGKAHFTDATHVVLHDRGETRFDVRTGAHTWRGNDGWPAVLRTPDGKHVVTIDSENAIIRETSDAKRERKVALPNWPQPDVAIDDQTVVIIQGRVIMAIDLATGVARQPTGELSNVLWIAPWRGTILTMSDRVRVRRGDGVIGEAQAYRMSAPSPREPITLFVEKTLESWDPNTDQRHHLASFAHYPLVVANGYALAGDDLVRIADGTRWLTLTDRVQLEVIDPSNTFLVVGTDLGRQIVEPAQKRVISLGSLGVCDDSGPLVFSPDGSRFAVQNHDRVIVFETATRKRLEEIPLGSNSPRWNMVSTDEILVAREHELELWDLRTRRSRSWLAPTGDSPTQIVVGENEVAVEYMADQLLWFDLAGLRTHAKPGRDWFALPAQQCWTAPGPSYAQIVR